MSDPVEAKLEDRTQIGTYLVVSPQHECRRHHPIVDHHEIFPVTINVKRRVGAVPNLVRFIWVEVTAIGTASIFRTAQLLCRQHSITKDSVERTRTIVLVVPEPNKYPLLS